VIDTPRIVQPEAQLTLVIHAAGPESSPDPSAWRTELKRPLIG